MEKWPSVNSTLLNEKLRNSFLSVGHSQKVILNYVKFNVSALYKSFEIATKRMKSQQIEEKSLVIADLLNSIIPEKKIESLISNHSKC